VAEGPAPVRSAFRGCPDGSRFRSAGTRSATASYRLLPWQTRSHV